MNELSLGASKLSPGDAWLSALSPGRTGQPRGAHVTEPGGGHLPETLLGLAQGD